MRKTLPILLTMGLLSLAVAAILALPWGGISYLSEWHEIHEGRIVFSFPHCGNVIALTFDDGPDPRYTPLVLDTLKKQGIHATFFLCGEKVAQYPELARRIIADGHTVGNHTHSHPHLEKENLGDVRREMDRCEACIFAATGRRPALFRPPRGLLTRQIVEAVVEHSYKIITWSLAFDRASERDSRVLRRRVVRLARPGDILLMHDGSRAKWDERAPTVRELDHIIIGLKGRGFRFVTVSEMLARQRPIAPVARSTRRTFGPRNAVSL